jgi:DNA-binding YbaB/EbfC family protein
MSSFQKMLKRAQQMQQDVEKTQSEIAKTEFSHASNGVEVVVVGNFTVKSIRVAPELLGAAADKEMLEDCLLVVINGALAKARTEMEKRMSSITGGLNLPGIM